jgi:hypothetical protein
MIFERGRCCGGALDRHFGAFSIRLCALHRLASGHRRSFEFFRVLFCFGSKIEDGRGFARGTGDDTRKLRGEFAVGAVVGGNQESLEIGYKSFCVQLFAFEPQPLSSAACSALPSS